MGLFEAVFFRGFVQARLESSLRPVAGTGGASGRSAADHLAFGAQPSDVAVMLGLGVTSAIAFGLVRNVAVLWPLLVPAGSFSADVKAGELGLPKLAVAGYVDLLGLMLLVICLAWRRQRRATSERRSTGGRSGHP